MRRCRRSARRFAPLLALASTGAPRRRRPGSAALRGYGLLGRRHDERPPFGGLVLCGVADGHIQERAATAGAHIRLHIVRLEPFSAREGVVMFQVGHQLVNCLCRVDGVR